MKAPLRNVQVVLLLLLTMVSLPTWGGSMRSIGAGPMSRDELAATVLDDHAFAATQDDFADLRLRDAQGRSIPFLLEKRQLRQRILVDEFTEGRILSLAEQPDNSLDLVAHPHAAGFAPTQVVFKTPLRDFEKQVSVWGVTADNRETPLAEAQPIFDHSRFADVRRLQVHLASAAHPFTRYRIRITQVTDVQASALAQLTRTRRAGEDESASLQTALRRRDFRIESLSFGRVVSREDGAVPLTVERPVTVDAVTYDEKQQQTEVLLRSERQPLSVLQVQTDERNFSRSLEVQARAARELGAGQWHRMGSGRIRDLAFRNLRERELSVPISETRATRYRVLIQDQDSAPLSIRGVTAQGPVYQVIFLAESGQSYCLVYGDSQAAAPQFDQDVLEVIRAQKGGEMVYLELGPPEPFAISGRPGWLHLLNTPVAMGIGAVLAVLVLGWGIVRALKHIESASETPDH